MSKKESEFIHDDPIKSEENATEKEKNEEVSGSPSSSPFSSPDKKRSKREVSDPITIEKPNSSDPQQQATTSKVIPLWVAGASPVKFVSFDELIKMNDSIEKMSIVHKIATEPDCKVEDLKPKDALYETVKSNMHKAFWNKLREDLAKDPPDHAHAFVLLKDLKEMVLEHLKSANLNNALSAVEETLDLDHLESLLDRGILNFESVLKAVLGILEQLCAPIRDELVARLKEERDLVELFRGIFTLVESMQMDMANFTLSQHRQLIGTYSAQIEFEEFTKLMDIDKGAADNTKRWLGRVLADYLDSNQPSSSSSAAELTRSDVNELIVNFYLALLTTSPTEQLGIGPYPETIKIDEPKIGALGEKFLQLELTVAAIFIASNLVGKAICEGGQFKAELKRDLIAILNDVDWKNYAEKLENVAVQCARKCKESIGNEWNEQQEDLLKRQINGISRMDEPVRVIAKNRIREFIEEVLRRTGEPLRVPAGLGTVQSELASVASRFYAIAVHNWNAFGRFYGKLLDQLYEETRAGGAR